MSLRFHVYIVSVAPMMEPYFASLMTNHSRRSVIVRSMVVASRLRNSLPQNIRSTSSLFCFKTKMKTFLFKQVFHDYLINFIISILLMIC